MATGIIEELRNKLLLKRYTASYGGSISAGSTKRMTASEMTPAYAVPNGYYPVGITYFATGNQYLALDYLMLRPTTNMLAVKNVASSASGSTAKATFDVLFAPEWMVEEISADEPKKPSGDVEREPAFKTMTFSASYSNLGSGSGKTFTRENVNFFVPEGYEIFSLNHIHSGSQHVTFSDCDPFSGSRFITVRNTHSSALSGTAAVQVVFINRKYAYQDPRNGLIIRYNTPTQYKHHTESPDFFSIVQGSYNECVIFNNKQCLPSAYPYLVNNMLRFSLSHYDTSDEHYHNIYPKKVEIISGGEYINFINSCYYFKIPEDFTDRQIILEFTFE